MDFKRLIREELSDFEWVGDITTEKTVGEWLKLSNQELEEIFYESKPIVKLTGKTYLDSDKQGFINIDKFIGWINGGTYLPLNESEFGWVSDIEETSNLIPMETHIGTEFRIFWDNDSWLGPVMKKWYHVGSGDTFKLKSIETYQEGITTQFVGDSGEDGKFSLSVPLDTEFDDENWRPSKYGIHIEWV